MHRRQQRQPCPIWFFDEIDRDFEEARTILDLKAANASWFWPQVFAIGGKRLCLFEGGDNSDGGIGEVSHVRIVLFSRSGDGPRENSLMPSHRMTRDKKR